MKPDERSLRRALAARSGDLDPSFHSQLTSKLTGAPARGAAWRWESWAVAAALMVAVLSMGGITLARHLQPTTPRGNSTLHKPKASPSPTAMASPTIVYPTTADLSAPSSSVLWDLVGGIALFRSADQGRTWQRRSLPPGLINPEISFADARDGWLLSVDWSEQCQVQSFRLWETSDGAASWSRLRPSGVGDAQCKEGLSFIDARHGFLTTYDETNAPHIYRTSDGGKAWSAAPALADPPGFRTRSGGFTLHLGPIRQAGSKLFVVAEAPPQGAYVYSSGDDGATWQYAATMPAGDPGIGFVTNVDWIAPIVPGQSRQTLDGGRTWHVFTSCDYNQAAPVAPTLLFVNAQVGYATVRGGIQLTTDGGVHWILLRAPGT